MEDKKQQVKRNNKQKGLITGLAIGLALSASAAIIAPIIVSSIKTNSSVGHISDSTTKKNIEVNSQKETQATFEFTTNKTLSTQYLTALAQMDNEDETNFVIAAKAYADVQDNKVVVTVTFIATNVDSINDTAKFHITFTNSDPNDTWAQTITGLSLSYASPFLDYSFEYEGYVFKGNDEETSGTRKLTLNLDKSVTTSSVKIENFKKVSGGITIKEPTLNIDDETRIATISIPYTSTGVETGDATVINFTLTCSTSNGEISQDFTTTLIAVDELRLIDEKSTITNGGDVVWFYWEMALPMGAKETVDDVKVEITRQDHESGQPMHLNIYQKQLDAESNYFSVIFSIEEGYVNPILYPKTTFDLKITKPDTRSTEGYEEGDGSAAWSQEFKNLEIDYDTVDGEFLDIVNQSTVEGTFNCGNKKTFTQKFTPNKDTIRVDDFIWTIEFTLDKSSISWEPEHQNFSDLFQTVEASGQDSETLSIQITAVDSWPTDWREKASSYQASAKWNINFIAKREITTSIGTKRYQKQTFAIDDWLKTDLR